MKILIQTFLLLVGIALWLLLSGCSSLQYSEDRFGSPKLVTNRKLNQMHISEVIHERASKDTTNRTIIKGYVSDQVAALEYLSKITADLRAITEKVPTAP